MVKHESTTVFEKWVSNLIFRIKYEKLESLTEGIMLIPSVEFRAAIVPMTGHSLSHFLNNNFLRNLLAFRTRVIRMSIKWNVRMSLMYTSIKYRKVVSCTVVSTNIPNSTNLHSTKKVQNYTILRNKPSDTFVKLNNWGMSNNFKTVTFSPQIPTSFFCSFVLIT